jgi:hypothetical protein
LGVELFRKLGTFLFLARERGKVVGSVTFSARPSGQQGNRFELADPVASPPSVAGPGSARRFSTPSTPSSRGSASTIR